MGIDREFIGTNDDGTGETGTVVNESYIGALCDAIDAMFASTPLTGIPTAPTAAPGTATDQLATTAFVAAARLSASVYNNAAQAITSGSYQAVTFNSEDFDAAAMHSTSVNPSRITIPVGGAGVWDVKAFVMFASTSGSGTGRFMHIEKNGAPVAMGYTAAPSTAFFVTAVESVLLTLAEGDYLQVFAYQDSGSPMDLGGNTAAAYNRFQAVRVG